MKRVIFICSIIISLCIISTPALSLNLRFLDDTVVSEFNEDDHKLLRDTIKDALENHPDDAIITWSNPETGSSGSLKPIKTYLDHSTTCRRMKIINKTAGQTGKSIFNFCKQPDGTWKIAPNTRRK